ncbi:uncharacterized protein LOC126371157 [Pectinophora gossypiella]|uniref:uncharacterized protein LOC126371157 n=1 Tax=Pectinophora gossypiella TaxID=13191 RepID=UPI00214ED717|nr:uncharacterized protein LOC126371157 [Pectinophora gossypiella]
MLSGKFLLCAILFAAWQVATPASLPALPSRIGNYNEVGDGGFKMPVVLTWAKVREGVPPPLCAGRCASPPHGPVCAFDATGTARTFATLCELEAVSCRESTYYAITSLGEC